MTNEENKAIENLKEVVDLYNDECLITTDYDFKSIEILLNLIENQSKEIEELKYRVREHICIEAHEQVKQFYISKDKIKAKIEEIKNDCKKCRFTGFCKDLLKNNQCSQGEVIKVLNKLLEE